MPLQIRRNSGSVRGNAVCETFVRSQSSANGCRSERSGKFSCGEATVSACKPANVGVDARSAVSPVAGADALAMGVICELSASGPSIASNGHC